MSRLPLVFNYGGGINSGAMLIGAYERGIRPDHIWYADPGDWLKEPAEKPETYEYIEYFSTWLVSIGFPAVTVLRHATDTLYRSCLRNGTLPSISYGFKGCSVKFKHQIIEGHEKKLYGPDHIIEKAIGYHALEDRGSGITEKGRYRYRYFLKEWAWDQQDCTAAFGRHGHRVPPKSSCWFCSAMKPREIVQLHKIHPELSSRAVGMERHAKPYHASHGNVTKGLGRSYSWESVIAADEAQVKMFPDSVEINCMCSDGDDE